MSDSSSDTYFTTNPKELLSVQTAVNAAVWTGAAGLVGSYFQVPTPYGLVNLGGITASAGLITYAVLVLQNQIKDEVTIGGGNIPITDEAKKNFETKYGVSFQVAFLRYLQETWNYDLVIGYGWPKFYAWCDKTYLHIIGPSLELSEPLDISKVTLGPIEELNKLPIPLQPLRKHIIHQSGFLSAPPEERDIIPLLLILGSGLVGGEFGSITTGALVGTGAALVYNNKKRKADELTTPALTIKRRKLSYEELAALGQRIEQLRKQLNNPNLTNEQRNQIQQQIDEATEAYLDGQ